MGVLLACLVFAGAAAASSEALLEAARADDTAAVNALLGGKVSANAREEDGTTALGWAAQRTNVAMAEALLKAGADPNLATELGITPLAIAVQNASVPLARLLLGHRADPNRARENGETPLMIAARLGHTGLAGMLLDAGAKVNAAESRFGQTALMWAAGSPETVRLLVSRGAAVGARTREWEVKYTIYAPTTVTLGKTGIPWNTDGEYTAKRGGLNALHLAVQKHDLESARVLLDAGVDVNQAAADGTTPLLAALYTWDSPNLTFVPGRGAPAQAGSSQKFTPDLALAALLLDRGARADVSDGAGYTPLHGAALAVANATLGPEFRRGGAYGGKAALLSLGRPAKDAEATRGEALRVVSRLLEGGADPNRATLYPTPGPAGDVRINPAPPGSTAFHIAAASRNRELVRLLAGKGGDPNRLRKDGHTPFSVAVMAGDVAIVEEMVGAGADLERRYDPTEKIPDPVEPITVVRQKQSIQHIAALGGSAAVIAYLHEKGASVEVRNGNGETPLDLADHQERYREAIQRQGAEGDEEKLRAVVRDRATSDAIRRLQKR